MGEVASVELIKLSNKELAYWVERFITEVCKKDDVGVNNVSP